MDELHALRQKIDLLDCQLVELFEQRMELVCQIAKLKQRQHIPILQKRPGTRGAPTCPQSPSQPGLYR
ncbi:MAG: chorismate mutase [Flavonifractor plautii]